MRGRLPRSSRRPTIRRSQAARARRRRYARSRRASSRFRTTAATRATPTSDARSSCGTSSRRRSSRSTPKRWCLSGRGLRRLSRLFRGGRRARRSGAARGRRLRRPHERGARVFDAGLLRRSAALDVHPLSRRRSRAAHLPRARASGRLREGRHVVQRVVRGRRRGGGPRALAQGAAGRARRRGSSPPTPRGRSGCAANFARSSARRATACRPSMRSDLTDDAKRAQKAAGVRRDARAITSGSRPSGTARRSSTAGSPTAPTMPASSRRASTPTGSGSSRRCSRRRAATCRASTHG